jgi:hypothetical protein
MAKVQILEVTHELSLYYHVQKGSMPTQLYIQHEQRHEGSMGVNVTTYLLLMLRSRICGVHLHVLDAVVTLAFILKLLIGLFGGTW